MQHKLINTGDYLLIVDDKTLTDMPNNINVYSVRYNKPIRFAETENSYMNECFEIKAHLPLKNSPILEGVDLLPPHEDDVEKLAKEEILYNDQKRAWWKQGYNKAKEKYKYTEEDLRNVIKLFCKMDKIRDVDFTINEYIQKPKMPVGFECEMEDMKMLKNRAGGVTYFGKPKTTTNSQGIAQWVGEYIY
jgi:hypothetical protein